MSNKEKMPAVGGSGPETGNDEKLTTDTMIPQIPAGVNPLPFDAELPSYPLPVSGGKVAWAIEDTIATLLAELKARGLDLPDSEIDQAVANTWLLMSTADYVKGRLRTWGDQQWRQNWERHLKTLREQGNEEVVYD